MLILSGLFAMITTYSLLYPILGNDVGSGILGIAALIVLSSLWITINGKSSSAKAREDELAQI